MNGEYDLELDSLLEQIRTETEETVAMTGWPTLSAPVIRAMRQVPRHDFVPEPLQYIAYANRPLPIGHGQTISQPFVVALMTDLIRPRADAVVLEVGTGSGYQAAILAKLVRQVYSLEIVEPLAAQARDRLRRLGYDNVEVRVGDGHAGWPEHAPFDAIMVTAAAPAIPPALVEQLKPGGRMVIPVGSSHTGQSLLVLDKDEQGRIEERNILPVIFVPLTDLPGA